MFLQTNRGFAWNIWWSASNGMASPASSSPAPMQAAPYQVKAGAEALVIGCGGGIDILIGLYHGARSVVGVDVNPHTIEFLKETYKEFAGGGYPRDAVEL